QVNQVKMKQILKLNEQSKLGKIYCGPIDIFKKIEKINIDYEQEHLLGFFFNPRCRLIKCKVLFKGSDNECVCDPKVIYRKALKYKACAIAIAHNHPTNDLTPSWSDIDIAKNLRKVGKIIGVQFLDSIIFNEKEFYSLDESGEI
ncbi:MAG: JAB domain-containing protein, partial [Victivallaceae bacterium]|nr:JAB domain-containing protein [Victivallaceae bacterium]